MSDNLRRNCITSLTGHYYDTRGIVREGFCNTDPRLNSGPQPSRDNPVPINSDRRPYVSIDIETTGVDYEYCQVLEFGAVVDDWVTPVENLPRFHTYLIHDRIQGEPKGLAMNAKILDRIADRDKPECANFTFIEPEKLAGMFEFWAASWGAFGSGQSGKSLIPAGKNFQGFDRPFLKRLPRFGRVNMLHRCIDPAMQFWNPATDQEPPSTLTCYQRAGIPTAVAHNAVDDAIGIVRLIRAAVNKSGSLSDAMDQIIYIADKCDDKAVAVQQVKQVAERALDPRPQSAKELAHKLADYFRERQQYTGQK